VAKGAGCCGALVHHMGRTDESHAAAIRNVDAWMAEVTGDGLDAIVINTSGCGTTVKDYGHMLAGTDKAEDARTVAGLARDVTEVLADLLPDGAPDFVPDMARRGIAGTDADHTPGGVAETAGGGLAVAYHAACSLQHGQKVTTAPKALLKRAGFRVMEPADPHLCCGSAGTYNLMQPEISAQLGARKVATLEAARPEVIAAGNIGCMMQIGRRTKVPVVHTVELLDWATGGPMPPAMQEGHRRPPPMPDLRSVSPVPQSRPFA